jgi:hypothetical protein
MMQNAEATEDYYIVAKELYNVKACDYFNQYMIAYCEKAFEHMTKLTVPASRCNYKYICDIF